MLRQVVDPDGETGRRGGLKSPCPQGHAGSSPASGMTYGTFGNLLSSLFSRFTPSRAPAFR